VTRVCPVCQETDLPERSRFCLSCGADVEHSGSVPYTPRHLARDVLTTRTARDGERKEVTILFADVAGSLAMAESLDPEDIHRTMDGFFGLALDAVHAHRGTINQFRGDGLMALFGAPQTWGEDAARGLRAALAIREATQDYSRRLEEELGLPFVLRLGLHTGSVWVGSVGNDLRSDYTAEGPTVGTAARLEQAARPGQILVSGETARRARRFFEFRREGPRHFRGLSKPVEVYELIGAGPYRDRFEAERAYGLTPFVGRERELAWLRDAAARHALVQIRGEAGIGKSRLALEFVSTSPSVAKSAVLEARSREEDIARAYVPWLDLLRAWPHALPGADEAGTLARSYGGGASEPAGSPREFAERLGTLLRKAALPAEHAGLGRAGEAPLTVLLEDVHWMDPSSLEVLDRISRGTAGVRLVATSRSDLDRDGGRSEEECLELGPLTAASARSLAGSILESVDDAGPLSELAVERGGGNPLFVEEVARALRDGGYEIRESARLEMEWRRRPAQVPETLNGVVAARIDALSDPAKRLLQAAAVIGRPFDRALLVRVEPESQSDVDGLLGELLDRALICQRADQGFEFRHVLVRDVGYQQLLRERRSDLHRRCADVLEGRGIARTPDGASLVGFHFERAGLPTRAVAHLTRAGSAYLALGAFAEAVQHLRRAWEIHQTRTGVDPAGLIATGLALVSALNGLDRAGEASDVLELLATVELRPDERKRMAGICIEGGWIRFSEQGDVEGGKRLIERGLGLIEDDRRARRLQMGAHSHLVRMHTMDGEIQAAVESADRLRELALVHGDRFFEVFALGSRGSALCDRGDIKAALADCRDAVALADRGENEVDAALAYGFLAQAQVYAGELDDALAAAARARELGERTDQVFGVYSAAAWTGEVYLLQGDAARAAAEFESMARINQSWPSTAFRRARGRLALGEYAEAATLARACLEHAPGRVIRARALCTLGSALAGGGPAKSDEPLRALLESISICEHLGLLPHLAEARHAMADLCRLRGETDRALHHASQARDLYQACGAHLHAQRVEI